jgi:hypothetical protein
MVNQMNIFYVINAFSFDNKNDLSIKTIKVNNIVKLTKELLFQEKS